MHNKDSNTQALWDISMGRLIDIKRKSVVYLYIFNNVRESSLTFNQSEENLQIP